MTVTFECDDTLAGIRSCTGSQLLGEGQSQSATGTAVDLAGNVATTSRTFTVAAYTVSGFYSPVDMGGPGTPSRAAAPSH